MLPLVTGFVAGFSIAVLFSPRSGKAARGYIGSKASESVGYLKKQTDEVRESALDIVDRGKDAVLRQVERLATLQTNGAAVYHR